MILGALLVQGLRPGPHLFTQTPELLYAIFAAMFTANVMFLVLGLFGAKLFARVTLIPRALLWPAVFSLAAIGSYALHQTLLDVWIMLIFGLLGFVGKRYGFAAAPVIMGLILGELVERSLKQSLIIFDREWLMFFERPIVVAFFILTVVGLFWPIVSRRMGAIVKNMRPATSSGTGK